jgi:hypothetical protein
MHLEKIKAIPLLSVITLVSMRGTSCKADERRGLNEFSLKIVCGGIQRELLMIFHEFF